MNNQFIISIFGEMRKRRQVLDDHLPLHTNIALWCFFFEGLWAERKTNLDYSVKGYHFSVVIFFEMILVEA